MSESRTNISLYKLNAAEKLPDESMCVDLPNGYTYTIGEEEIGETVQMADGSIVFENSALRRTLSIECGYLPQDTYINLLTLRRISPLVYAIYVDVDGNEVAGVYRMDIGNRELFMFRDGEPVFKGVQIDLTAQEAN